MQHRRPAAHRRPFRSEGRASGHFDESPVSAVLLAPDAGGIAAHTVAASARGSPVSSRRIPTVARCDVCLRRTSHNASTTSGGTAQNASDGRQPPSRSAKGTAVAPAIADPAVMQPEYTPVAIDTRSRKSRLAMTGTSTLPIAMAAPTPTVPSHTQVCPPTERTTSPTASSASATATVASVPIRAVTSPTSGLIAANAHSGIAARIPCTPSPQFRSAPIRVSSGPTAAIAGRRFNATRNIRAAHSPVDGMSRMVRLFPSMPYSFPQYHAIQRHAVADHPNVRRRRCWRSTSKE